MKWKTLALMGIACLLPAQTPPPDLFLHWLDDIAQRKLDQREPMISGMRTVADADQRKQLIRGKLLQILGGLPPAAARSMLESPDEFRLSSTRLRR